MKKITYLFLCLFIVAGTLEAQTRRVTGVVTSSEDGEPIVGASVLIKGTTQGAVTDVSGSFELNVPVSSKTLVVSYVGMTSQDVTVSDRPLHIRLLSAIELEEVVVTALGIKREKRSLGYAASTVSGEELSANRSSSVLSAISGKIAGVQISSSSSDPGASNSIMVRGISSLNGNNQALFVIDGVPMVNNSTSSSSPLNDAFDYGNAANLVNPDDVASMTILKGAAATAVYGSRASNGVVLITTKAGSSRKGVGIEYNGGLQFSSLLRLPEFQNDYGQGWSGRKTADENGSWGPYMDGSMQLWGNVYNNSQKMKPYVAMPDNVKDFFETGFQYSNSLAFSGGNDKTEFYGSFSQLSSDGQLPDPIDTYDKYTFAMRGSHSVGKLKISASANYATQHNNFAPTGQGLTIINSLMQTPRDISIIGLKDLDDPFNSVDYYFTPYGVGNPYSIISRMKNEFDRNKYYGKIQADYAFTDYLSATYRLGLDEATESVKIGNPRITGTPGTPNEGAIDQEGNVANQSIKRRELNHELLLLFNKKFADRWDVNGTVGWNANERSASSLSASVTGLDIPTFYDLSNSSATPSVDESFSQRRLVGVFGEAQVGYRGWLYLTLSARNDWSSTLPVENNSFFYPGTALSFIFTDLLPARIKKTLSFGKVRLAYGKTGNDADVYLINPTYSQAAAYNEFGNIGFPLGGVNAFTLGNRLGNQNLSPEMTTEYEAGLNLTFFDGRINFDGAYYTRTSDKQIFNLTMDPSTGFSSQTMNLGEISNKGVELLLTVVPVLTHDLSWELSFNYTKNVSEVVSLPAELSGEAQLWSFSSGTGIYAAVGHPIGVYKTYSSAKSPDGRVVVNADGLPVQSGESTFYDDANFDYEMGIGNTLRYKGWSLGFDFDIRQGGVIYSRTKDIMSFTGNSLATLYNSRRPFVVPNSVVQLSDGSYVENTIPVSVANLYRYFSDLTPNGGEDFLIPRSYVKLRTARIGYTLPKRWLRWLPGVGHVELSAYGENLLLWTPLANIYIDPEVSTFGNDLVGKFGEFSANPSTRRYGFNLSVKF